MTDLASKQSNNGGQKVLQAVWPQICQNHEITGKFFIFKKFLELINFECKYLTDEEFLPVQIILMVRMYRCTIINCMDKLSYYLMVRAVTNLATDMKGFLEATFLGTVMINAMQKLNFIVFTSSEIQACDLRDTLVQPIFDLEHSAKHSIPNGCCRVPKLILRYQESFWLFQDVKGL